MDNSNVTILHNQILYIISPAFIAGFFIASFHTIQAQAGYQEKHSRPKTACFSLKNALIDTLYHNAIKIAVSA